MVEELRLFLRIALFGALVGTVYWFITYEWAGSLLLAFVVVGAGLFTLFFALTNRATRPRLASIKHTLGFEEQQETPLEVADAPLPTASIWPLMTSAAALLVGHGLIFGAWLWLPGLALGLLAAAGWVLQLRD